MAFPLPPWLSPTASQTFIDAAKSGAQIGLQQQQQAEQALEAAQRNSLGFAQIGAQERDTDSRTAAMRDDAAIRANDLLMGRNNQVQEQATAASDLDKFRQAQLDEQTQNNEATNAIKSRALDGAASALDAKQGMSRYKTLAVQSAAAYKAANPDVSPAELISRFPGAFQNPSGSLTTPAKIIAQKPVPPEFSNGIQDQIFKQALLNSQGGTNIDQAVSSLRGYTRPQAAPIDASGVPAPATDLLTQLPDLTGVPSAQPAAPVSPAGGSGNVPTVNSQSDYDALPPGARYVDSNGNLATKKAAQ